MKKNNYFFHFEPFVSKSGETNFRCTPIEDIGENFVIHNSIIKNLTKSKTGLLLGIPTKAIGKDGETFNTLKVIKIFTETEDILSLIKYIRENE